MITHLVTPWTYDNVTIPEAWLHYHNLCPRGDGSILKHHDVALAVRPHRNRRQILVHPKVKLEDKCKTDCVY